MKIKKIYKIKFECENYANITFTGNELIKVNFRNLRECDGDYICDYANIIISYKANDITKYRYMNYSSLSKDCDLFETIIQTHNIQTVTIYTKKKIKKIYIPYYEEAYGPNRLQNSYLDNVGNIHITIVNNYWCDELIII